MVSVASAELKASPYSLHCCALSQPSSRQSNQLLCGAGLSWSDGTSSSWRDLLFLRLRRIFTSRSVGILGRFVAWGVWAAFSSTEWAEVGVIDELRACDAVLLCMRCVNWCACRRELSVSSYLIILTRGGWVGVVMALVLDSCHWGSERNPAETEDKRRSYS